MSEMGEMGHFGAKINLFQLSINVPDDRHLKVGKSDNFGLLGKILTMPKIGLTGNFRPKIKSFNFFS